MKRWTIFTATAAMIAVASIHTPSNAATVNGPTPDVVRLNNSKLQLACNAACQAKRAVEAAERKAWEMRMKRMRTPPGAGAVRG